METGDTPVDLGRLSKPEADAFRHIAEVLGARFEGDEAAEDHEPAVETARDDATTAATFDPSRNRGDRLPDRLPGPPATDPRTAVAPRGSALDADTADRRLGPFLDRIPVSLMVVSEDRVVFMNRTALSQLGYNSASVVDAVGGFGALFDGGRHESGLMAMVTSGGGRFLARVTMAPITWADSQCMIVTVLPAPVTGHGGAARMGDGLQALLDANPDPVALVARSGCVESCNESFRRLATRDGAVMALADCLNDDDAHHVVDLVDLAFGASGGVARSHRPVTAGDVEHAVSVGALPGGRVACVILHTSGEGWPDPASAPLPSPSLAMSAATPRASPPSIGALPASSARGRQSAPENGSTDPALSFSSGPPADEATTDPAALTPDRADNHAASTTPSDAARHTPEPDTALADAAEPPAGTRPTPQALATGKDPDGAPGGPARGEDGAPPDRPSFDTPSPDIPKNESAEAALPFAAGSPAQGLGSWADALGEGSQPDLLGLATPPPRGRARKARRSNDDANANGAISQGPKASEGATAGPGGTAEGTPHGNETLSATPPEPVPEVASGGSAEATVGNSAATTATVSLDGVPGEDFRGRSTAQNAAVPLWGGPSRARSALDEAAGEVRKLVADTAVLIVTEGDCSPGEADTIAEVDFLRLLLLAIAARASAGSVVVARREGEMTTVTLSGDAVGPFEAALSSDRIASLAHTAGATLHLSDHGQLVVKHRPARLPDNVIRLDAHDQAARGDRSG